MSKIIYIILTFAISTSAVHAQFLRKLQEKVQSEFIDKVADKISDALAEDLANKAYKPIDEAFDEAYQESDNDSTEAKSKSDYSSILKNFDEAAAKLPAEYHFDIVNHMEIEDTKGKIDKMKMLFPHEGDYFGMETEDKGKTTLLVYDLKNEIMAMYTEEKGKKSVNVMPSMMDFAAAYLKNSDKVDNEFTFEKTGKTKTILGYNCEEYKVESEKYITYSFVTKDFPISWRDSYGKLIEKFAPAAASGVDDLNNSMTLYSETKYKKDLDKSSFMEVVKIDQSGFNINNGEYEKVTYNK